MYAATSSRVCSVSLALSLAATLTPGVVQAMSAALIHGSGNYSDDAKWDPSIASCNLGSTTFNINIPAVEERLVTMC